MTPISIAGMEPHIKQRYWFAVSAFARMYSPNMITLKMELFCYSWALSDNQSPLGSLHNVDIYFKKLWIESNN